MYHGLIHQRDCGGISPDFVNGSECLKPSEMLGMEFRRLVVVYHVCLVSSVVVRHTIVQVIRVSIGRGYSSLHAYTTGAYG